MAPSIEVVLCLRCQGGEKYDPPHRAVRVRDRAINKSDGAWIKSEFGVHGHRRLTSL